MDNKIESLNTKIDDSNKSLNTKIDDSNKSLNANINGVRQSSENAHQSIRDDLCDLKVTTTAIKTDVEWLKNERKK